MKGFKMMNKKEYLTEENYERTKNKIKNIALIILIAGILVGGGLIVTGIIKTNSMKAEIENKETQRTEQDVQNDIDAIVSKIGTIDTEITNLYSQVIKNEIILDTYLKNPITGEINIEPSIVFSIYNTNEFGLPLQSASRKAFVNDAFSQVILYVVSWCSPKLLVIVLFFNSSDTLSIQKLLKGIQKYPSSISVIPSIPTTSTIVNVYVSLSNITS